MWLSDISVKRPVFATVLSMLLVAIGAMSFRDLTVRENPDTVAPTVQVQVSYPGANAEVIDRNRVHTLEFDSGAPSPRRYTRAKVIDMIFFVAGGA